ncbi:acyl carrier protein [Caldinitratiruptor microaerophilus]|uniref:Carrier domain-containing protein n=1 Tax=Caldinitratiruptor microaerophilus TaxID=671077 RepID=A0AA35CL72_9FIRM|nr:phosphopantetheine-binding protein [Caldinitratiruptor microaerophilus]BDG61350.1 hypothetical protein caldi_24400 [Caldinitratiruptor microaerophilus]
MHPKQEALRFIRELAGRRVTYDTGLMEVAEEIPGGLEVLVERIQDEFGVELPEELVLEADTVGDLCRLVAHALTTAAETGPDGPVWEAREL